MQNLLERLLVEPTLRLLRLFGQALAPLVTVLFILLVGALLAYVARRIVFRLLTAMKFDRFADRAGFASSILRTRAFATPSDFAARLAQGAVWLFVVLLALSAADTTVTETLVVRFVNYVPSLVTATVVLLLGAVLSNFVARSTLLAAVNAQWPGARMLAGVVRLLGLLLTGVIALEQLGIGRTAVIVSFAILFGGVVIAAAIAFGLGARDLAREWLSENVKPRTPEEETFHHL
jgi:hypothetical protein